MIDLVCELCEETFKVAFDCEKCPSCGQEVEVRLTKDLGNGDGK